MSRLLTKNNNNNETQSKINKQKLLRLINSIITSDNPKNIFENLNKLFLFPKYAEAFLFELFSIPKKDNDISINIDQNKLNIKSE